MIDATCELPCCTAAEIRTTLAVTIAVKGKSGNPYPDLPVYAFTVTAPDPASGLTEPVVTYSGYNGKTDAEGIVNLTLPYGNVEEYVSVIAGQTVTTTYRYNEARVA